MVGKEFGYLPLVLFMETFLFDFVLPSLLTVLISFSGLNIRNGDD
jgi:hypothetical protein